MNIVIVDDHPILRMGVRTTLEEAGHCIVGELTSSADVFNQIRALSADLVILDVDTTKVDGVMTLRRLRKLTDGPKVLILTGCNSIVIGAHCIIEGACGYIEKTSNRDTLIAACQAIANGAIYFPANLMQAALEKNLGSAESNLAMSLSLRELNILRRVILGHKNVEIAHSLRLSEKTINTYKTRAQNKLNIHSILELADFAKLAGLS